MKKSKRQLRKKQALTPQEHLNPRSRKINTMIQTLIQSIDENFISLEELKYVIREVEKKLKERKK